MAERKRNNTILWLKLGAWLAVVLYVLAFMMINVRHTADVWLYPFGGAHRMPTLLVILLTALLSTAGWWLGSQVYRAWRRRKKPA